MTTISTPSSPKASSQKKMLPLIALTLTILAVLAVSSRTISSVTGPSLGVANNNNSNNNNNNNAGSATSLRASRQASALLTPSLLSSPSKSTTSTMFDAAVKQAFAKVVTDPRLAVRKPFDLVSWTERSKGGLKDSDRLAIADIYTHADSVFEFGLGESTKIASHVGVPNYAGIDSDPVWVTQTRSAVASHFRFYLADIGETKMWGQPVGLVPKKEDETGNSAQSAADYADEQDMDNDEGDIIGDDLSEGLPKMVLDYQLAPLIVEPLPFDVYLVDGRWRVGCVLASFLHAAARGAPDLTRTTVLLHDCHRPNYDVVDYLFEKRWVAPDSKLCSFHRRPDTTDEMIFEAWNKYANQTN